MMESPLSAIPGADLLGREVIRELPDVTGVAAWQVLRWVVLWADEGRGSTEDLFDRDGLGRALLDVAGDRPIGAGEDPRVPLVAVIGELMQPMPDAELIARACLCMSEWALPLQHLSTGLLFAEAAAYAMPAARYAFLAAKLHRQYGRHVDADRLLKVAEGLARGEKDWETGIRVRLARGNVDLLHGHYERARDAILQALRVCARHRITGALQAEAYHDLLVAEAGLRSFASAVEHAETAMAGYGPDHPRLPHLMHDLAGIWMELGDYQNALRVLTPLVEHRFLSDPLPRLIACGSAARAAAGAGDRTAYTRFAREVDAAVSRAGPVTVRHGPALVAAARGAAMAEDAPRMDAWSRLAVSWGEQMEQADVIADAQAAAHRPSPPATARSRVRRHLALAEKAVARLAESASM